MGSKKTKPAAQMRALTIEPSRIYRMQVGNLTLSATGEQIISCVGPEILEQERMALLQGSAMPEPVNSAARAEEMQLA